VLKQTPHHEDILVKKFLTSALDVGELSASRPSRFTYGERSLQYTLDRRLDGSQSLSGHYVQE
jgi:hypothetical protein